MAEDHWPTKPLFVNSLHLDPKNPRLGRESLSRAPREIIQYLFEHDKALEIADSISTRGYFSNEPLLAIRENDRLVVVEGNRRLAALKALREPGLLEGSVERQVERFSRRIANPQSIVKVPVTIAPSRKATDRLIAGRHIGTPVLAWQAENRASFILDKLEEGYTNDELHDQLGFTLPDIQKARQIRAIADMARSLDLSDEVKAKIENPRAKLFTTLERVIESSVGRKYLLIEPDPDHGLRGTTTKNEFIRGFTKLVTDVVLGNESSRSLNTNDNIESYFKRWKLEELPSQKQGSFVPAEIIAGRSVASSRSVPGQPSRQGKTRQLSKTVIPKSFKVRYGDDRLVEIREELVKLRREDFPNAGAVLLRVFLEIAILDYLERTGDLKVMKDRLESKGRLRQGIPTMKDLRVEIVRIAKSKLPEAEANRVEKALRNDPAAPFGLDDLHSFVHQGKEFPGDRDILQFWARTEPLFRMMLERPAEVTENEAR